MRPIDWPRMAALFVEEKEKRRIGLKKFCAEQGLKYGTARAYIKVGDAVAREKFKRTNPVPKSSPVPQQPEKIADDFKISEKEFLFARLIAQGVAKYIAFLDAGFEWKGKGKPYSESSRVARKPRVRQAIYYFKEKIQHRYTLEFDEVVAQLMAIIRADPNELTQYRRVNCRHCYGINHAYQWRDEAELRLAQAEALGKELPPPDESGGFGFADALDPHPECPHCNGEGIGRMFNADTRDIEGDARYLLEGVTMTKLGPAILMASKMEARKELVRLHALTSAPGETTETLALRAEILREELRKKRAEADRIEEENALRKKANPGNSSIVIELVNSPDAPEEDADDVTE